MMPDKESCNYNECMSIATEHIEVKAGKLYQISSLIRPEEMDKYSEAIENMFKSVKFH